VFTELILPSKLDVIHFNRNFRL